MLKILTVVGARPQIIKAAAISRAISKHFSDSIQEVIVHTGQHYDQDMSQVFIDELGIPQPDYNLEIGSAPHGEQTAAMIMGIEMLLEKESPDYLVVYGDTNSTLAGAIAASKLHIPIVHIEAGLRSFNKSMPEEINRILCDHVSSFLFTPTESGFNNLIREGFSTETKSLFTADKPGLFHCGDVMYDNSIYFEEVSEERSNILETLGLSEGKFILATLHRNNNTDEAERLNVIFKALNKITIDNEIKLVLPLHPRTRKALDNHPDQEFINAIKSNPFIRLIDPVSFLDMIQLESQCQIVITDSGGVQKEAYFFKKPCIVLRSETEWVEIISSGSGFIADADESKIINAYTSLTKKAGTFKYPPIFGDGAAAEFICQTILENKR